MANVFYDKVIFSHICSFLPFISQLSLMRAFPGIKERLGWNMYNRFRKLVADFITKKTGLNGTTFLNILFSFGATDLKLSGGLVLSVLLDEDHLNDVDVYVKCETMWLNHNCHRNIFGVLYDDEQNVVKEGLTPLTQQLVRKFPVHVMPDGMSVVDIAQGYPQVNLEAILEMQFKGYDDDHMLMLQEIVVVEDVPLEQHITKAFDLEFCRNFLDCSRLHIEYPFSVLRKQSTLHCNDITQKTNKESCIFLDESEEKFRRNLLTRYAVRIEKYRDRDFEINVLPADYETIPCAEKGIADWVMKILYPIIKK